MSASPDGKQNEIRPDRRTTVRNLIIIGAFVLLLAAVFPLVSTMMSRMIPPCFLLTFTGLRCPLCGGTRCVRALTQFDLAQALYYNPMVVISAVLCVYYFIRVALACCRRNYVPYSPRLGYKTWYVLLVAFLIFFIVRNTPIYQTWLY